MSCANLSQCKGLICKYLIQRVTYSEFAYQYTTCTFTFSIADMVRAVCQNSALEIVCANFCQFDYFWLKLFLHTAYFGECWLSGVSMHIIYYIVHILEILIIVWQWHSKHDPTCAPSTICHTVSNNALWVMQFKYEFS